MTAIVCGDGALPLGSKCSCALERTGAVSAAASAAVRRRLFNLASLHASSTVSSDGSRNDARGRFSIFLGPLDLGAGLGHLRGPLEGAGLL